jgi:hypothetical protein
LGTDLWAEDSSYTCSAWKWPYLWAIVCSIADSVLTAEQCDLGYYNDHCAVTKEQAANVAKLLRDYDGTFFIKPPAHMLESLESLKKNVSMLGINPGKQKIKIDKEDLIELAEFMESSGGFTIS